MKEQSFPALPCRMLPCLTLLALAPLPLGAEEAEFRLGFRAPGFVAGSPEATEEAAVHCTLETRGLEPGSPGAQGWSFGVVPKGACRIRAASTFLTAAARSHQGGFEITELTRGEGNEGVVSAVILDSRQTVTLPPEETHDVLRLVLDLEVPEDGCDSCDLQYVSYLEGSGKPVPVLVTYENESRTPAVEDLSLPVCPLPCPPGGPTEGWEPWNLGEAAGTSRYVRETYRICGAAAGYGKSGDDLNVLYQKAYEGDFSLIAELADIEGDGLGGVEARAFTGTGVGRTSEMVEVHVAKDPDGGFRLQASYRESESASRRLSRPVAVDLPVVMRVRRQGSTFSASYSQLLSRPDDGYVTLLEVEAPGTGLDKPAFRLGLTQASGPADASPRGLRTATAVFSGPEVRASLDQRPPRIARAVLDGEPSSERPTKLVLSGAGLEEATEVDVAGIRAAILERTPNGIRVEVPPLQSPVRGDITVRTPTGGDVLPNSFWYYGEEDSGPLGCDCDGNGKLQLTDVVRNLFYQFVGGEQCKCRETGDCDADGFQNLTDAIYLLSFLFSGGPEPPDPIAGECGGLPGLPRITGVSRRTLRPGDIFTVEGEGFSPEPEENVVIAGNARLRVLDATPTALEVQVRDIARESVVDIGVIRDFGLFFQYCYPRRCYPVFVGPVRISTIPLELQPAADVRLVGRSEESDDGGAEIPIDPEALERGGEMAIEATVLVDPVPGVSPGSKRLSMTTNLGSLRGSKALERLADDLERELAGGSPTPEFDVVADTERRVLRILPQKELLAAIESGVTRIPDFDISILIPPLGRCGPEELHPINDERAFGWCRFQELVKPCNGLPAFEWYYTTSQVFSLSESEPFVSPNDRSPAEKTVLYNRAAYCHVRKHKLWDNCELDDLIADGKTEIPPFPRDAWVMKTGWMSHSKLFQAWAELPPESQMGGFDNFADQFYSYVWTGDGQRYYLTALHHTTKDIDDWFWMDIYYPAQVMIGPGFGNGLGGCGGTNLDAPPNITAPGSQWRSYFLCTNITNEQPLVSDGFAGVGPNTTPSAWCGNFMFPPECPTEVDGDFGDTCLNCHEGMRYKGILQVDFIPSLRNSVSSGSPCP